MIAQLGVLLLWAVAGHVQIGKGRQPQALGFAGTCSSRCTAMFGSPLNFARQFNGTDRVFTLRDEPDDDEAPHHSRGARAGDPKKKPTEEKCGPPVCEYECEENQCKDGDRECEEKVCKSKCQEVPDCSVPGPSNAMPVPPPQGKNKPGADEEDPVEKDKREERKKKEAHRRRLREHEEEQNNRGKSGAAVVAPVCLVAMLVASTV
mmetsp:Transcript_5494/g.13117  ORF Transcript_5494/g.13117 Transcript_5494/m.13117 type:complete len:206 (+) Transcript_5494:50-667(+)